MQKLISLTLLSISLFLLFLSMTVRMRDAVSSFPPFCGTQAATLPETQTLTGADFSIESVSDEPTSLYAKAYCLMDADTNRVLSAQDETEQLPMASTTKIMTCLIALESGNLSDTVTVSSYAASMPDVRLNMQAGDTFCLEDLLYSLMLESHNDTAVAIAEHIGGSVEGFAALMNEKAAELGCANTHFVTPNGLDDDAHYTTAEELCIIASYAIQNEEFLKIIQTPSYRLSNCDGTRSYSLTNHDTFLTSYDGAIGIKTGFTGNAGYCFCGAAVRDGKTFITSVLACGWPPNKSYKWSDTKKLMDYGFANFETKKLKRITLPESLPVENGTKVSVSLVKKKSKKLKATLCANDTITCTLSLPESLSAPIQKGDIVGYEEYYLNGTLLYQLPVKAGETVKERSLSYYLELIEALFFSDL